MANQRRMPAAFREFDIDEDEEDLINRLNNRRKQYTDDNDHGLYESYEGG